MGTLKSYEPEPNADKLRSESRRVTSVRSSWVQNGFGAVEMEEEFHHVELLMRKQPALPHPPPGACVSQPKWYVVYSMALEEKK